MMTRERGLLQQALDALESLFTMKVDADRAKKCGDAVVAIRACLAAQPAPAEDFCYCDDDISLQMVSGGAAPEGLYGRVTLKIGDAYVNYVKAQPAPVPLTDLQLSEIAVSDEFLLYCSQDEFNEIARAIERAHGIAASPEQPK